MPAGVLDENVDLRYSVKLDTIAATVRLKRFNYELAKTQALMASLSGGRVGGVGIAASAGRGIPLQRGGGITKGLAAQSAAIGVLSSRVSELGNAAKIAGAAMGVLGGFSLVQYAKWEKMEFSFAKLMGDRKKSDKLLKELKSYSGPLPLTTGDVVESARMMMGYGIKPENIMETTKLLGNIAIGLGGQISEILKPIGVAKSTGVLQGEEYNSLILRGVPLAEADYYSRVAEGKLKDTPENYERHMQDFRGYVMSQQYDWKQMERALLWMGNVKFAGAAEEAEDLLASKTSALADEMELLAVEFGKLIVESLELKERISGWTDAIKEFKESMNEEDMKKYIGWAEDVAILVAGLWALNKVIKALTWTVGTAKAGGALLGLGGKGGGHGRAAARAGNVGRGLTTAGKIGYVAGGGVLAKGAGIGTGTLAITGLAAAVLGSIFGHRELQEMLNPDLTGDQLDNKIGSDYLQARGVVIGNLNINVDIDEFGNARGNSNADERRAGAK